MRFSLKDLIWSVTFVCLGLACFSMVPNINDWRESYPYFFNLAGFWFGAAVGKLFHRMWMGVVCGSILFILFANLITTAHD